MSELPDPRDVAVLHQLGKALDRLYAALRKDVAIEDTALDASVQRFEFCIELTWKALKRFLEFEGYEAKSPKQTLQQAYAAEWISDEALWLAMLKDRNLTSHTYNENLAKEIYDRIHGYYPEMRRLHVFLTDRYEPHA